MKNADLADLGMRDTFKCKSCGFEGKPWVTIIPTLVEMAPKHAKEHLCAPCLGLLLRFTIFGWVNPQGYLE